MMEEGAIVICQVDKLFNGFGETQSMVTVGQRLTIAKKQNLFGTWFLSFRETPEGHRFQMEAFAPLRNYN